MDNLTILYMVYIARGQTQTYNMPIQEMHFGDVEEHEFYFKSGNKLLCKKDHGEYEFYFRDFKDAVEYKDSIIQGHIDYLKKEIRKLEDLKSKALEKDLKTDIESVSKVYDTLRLEGAICRIQNPEDNVYYVELEVMRLSSDSGIKYYKMELEEKYNVRFEIIRGKN